MCRGCAGIILLLIQVSTVLVLPTVQTKHLE